MHATQNPFLFWLLCALLLVLLLEIVRLCFRIKEAKKGPCWDCESSDCLNCQELITKVLSRQ